MLKLNDGGKQESEVARPFVVLWWCGIGGGISIINIVGVGREGKQV
jgi:hypothetical protein